MIANLDHVIVHSDHVIVILERHNEMMQFF